MTIWIVRGNIIQGSGLWTTGKDDLNCTGLLKWMTWTVLDYWNGWPELYWTTGLLAWTTWTVLDYWTTGMDNLNYTGLLDYWNGWLEMYWTTGMDDLKCTGLLEWTTQTLEWTTGLLEWTTGLLEWTTGLLEWTTGLLEWQLASTLVSGQDQSSMYTYMHAEWYWNFLSPHQITNKTPSGV